MTMEIIAQLLQRYGGPENYRERAFVQLQAWVAGNPVHNPIDNECVPDFSCCLGRARLAPEKMRERFMRDPASRRPMQEFWCVEIAERFPEFAAEVLG